MKIGPLATLVIAGLLAACTPGTASPTSTAAPTPPATTASPTRAAPSPTATSSSTDDGTGAGLAGGSATVMLGDETFQLATGDTPLCMLMVGVQVGMASEDRQVSLTVHALGDLNATNFALITPDDRWVPPEGAPRFEVAGTRASWSGTLVGGHTGRQEPAAIDITCGS